jgi:hypothetical protein
MIPNNIRLSLGYPLKVSANARRLTKILTINRPFGSQRKDKRAGTSTREERDAETGSFAQRVEYTFARFAAMRILSTCAMRSKVKTQVVTKARARINSRTKEEEKATKPKARMKANQKVKPPSSF